MEKSTLKRLAILLVPALMVSLAACTSAGGTLINQPTHTLENLPPTTTATPPAPQDIGSLLPIPAGTFQMGCDPAHNAGAACNDKNGVGADLHNITLDAYQIDKYEVTNAGYAKCVAAGACSAPVNFSSPTRPSYYD